MADQPTSPAASLPLTVNWQYVRDLSFESPRAPQVFVQQGPAPQVSIQVRVDGILGPGDESTQAGRTGYHGAGLTATFDAQNVVTLAYAVLQRPGQDPEPYANFEIRVAGRLTRFGSTGDHPLPKEGPVFLRLERRASGGHATRKPKGARFS